MGLVYLPTWYRRNQTHGGKYASPMDPMGNDDLRMDYFKSTTIPLVQRKLPNTLHPWLRCIKPFGDGFGKKTP